MSRSTAFTGSVDAPSASAIRFDRQHAIDRGRLLHAVAMSGAMGRTVRGVVAVARGVLGALGRMRRRRADTHALLAMSNHVLADIGLSRADVQGMACGVIPVGRVTRPESAPRNTVEVLRPRSHGRRTEEKLDAAA